MHELSYIWINYFWSSLKGNGPEALVQTVVYAGAAYLFIPPVRKYIDAHMKDIHKKMDHIIFHSKDIPPLPPSEPKIKP
jgi:hypothetical protein